MMKGRDDGTERENVDDKRSFQQRTHARVRLAKIKKERI